MPMSARSGELMKVANEILIPELARLIGEQKEVRFTPSGVSMRPFIEGDRDSVILGAYTRAPKRGDIVLARVGITTSPNYVLHRLVRIEGEKYILQGDGNIAGEEVCSRDDIIARVVRIECPDGRRKPLTRGYLWYAFKPLRKWLLKIYRHTWLKWKYEND